MSRTLGGRAELITTQTGDCGCPEEHYLFDGIDLIVHFEPNGDADAFLDTGDDCADWATRSGLSKFDGRIAAFRWAAGLLQGPPR